MGFRGRLIMDVRTHHGYSIMDIHKDVWISTTDIHGEAWISATKTRSYMDIRTRSKAWTYRSSDLSMDPLSWGWRDGLD